MTSARARTRCTPTTPAFASASASCSPATPTRPGPTSRSTVSSSASRMPPCSSTTSGSARSRRPTSCAPRSEACAASRAELLVDVYHLVGPRTVALSALGLESAWVVGGGYKYLQLGEGNWFLRLPPQAAGMRPAITGWFAEFDALAAAPDPSGHVAYGAGASRFAGATYDPTSHYRAARV